MLASHGLTRAAQLTLLAACAVAVGVAAGLAGHSVGREHTDSAFLAFALLTFAAGVTYLAWHVDAAWTLSGALVLSLFNGNWEALGIATSLAPDRMMVMLAIGVVVLRMLADPAALRPRWRAVHLVLAGVLVFAGLSAVVAGTLGDHAAQFRFMDRLGLVPFSVFVVAPLVFATEAQRRILLGTLVAVGTYLGATALFEALNVDPLVWPKYILDPSYGIHHDRSRGPFADANANGLMLFACAGAAFVAASRWQQRTARLYAVGVGVLCSLGVVFCLSRSVWVGAVVAAVVVVIAVPEARRFFLPGVVVAVTLVPMALILIPGLSTQAEERRSNQMTIWDRKNLNRAAVAMVEDRPLTGVGWGRYTQESANYAWQADGYPIIPKSMGRLPVHNVVLSNAAELGLLGVSLWLLGVGLAIVTGLRARARELRAWRALFVAYAALWLVVANFSPLVGVPTNMMFWLLAGIAGGEALRRRGAFAAPR